MPKTSAEVKPMRAGQCNLVPSSTVCYLRIDLRTKMKMKFASILTILMWIGYMPASASLPMTFAPGKPKAIQIPFTMDRNLIVISARLNDAEDCRFIFDTGTSNLTLSETIATRLKLTGEGFTSVGRPNDPNPAQARNVVLPAMAIEDFEIQNLAGVALADQDIFLPPGVAGIIGLHTFEGYLVTIDYAASKLVLTRGALKSGGEGVFAADVANIVEIKIWVAGKEMPANLDSGGPESMAFPLEWKSELPLKTEPVLFAKARTGSGEVEIYKSQLVGSIQIGDITLVDPEITLVSGGFPAINIGYPFLRKYALTVDMQQGLLRLLPPKKAKR
jgi:Aspartyl protease